MPEITPESTVTIELSDEGLLPTKEFTDFLIAFRTLYSITREYVRDADPRQLIKQPDEYVEQLRDICSQRTFEEMRGAFGDVNLGDYELQIVKLQKNSATIIVLLGVVSAVTGAAILSGGEVDMKILGAHIKFKLPPLADGLGKMKNLFKRA